MSQWEEDLIRRLRGENPSGGTRSSVEAREEKTKKNGDKNMEMFMLTHIYRPKVKLYEIKEAKKSWKREHEKCFWLEERLGIWIFASDSGGVFLVFHRKLHSSLVSGSILVHQQEETEQKKSNQASNFWAFLSPQRPSVPQKIGKRGWKTQFSKKFKAPQRFFYSTWIQTVEGLRFSVCIWSFLVIFLLLSVIKHSSTLLSNLIPVFLSARVQFRFNLPCWIKKQTGFLMFVHDSHAFNSRWNQKNKHEVLEMLNLCFLSVEKSSCEGCW